MAEYTIGDVDSIIYNKIDQKIRIWMKAPNTPPWNANVLDVRNSGSEFSCKDSLVAAYIADVMATLSGRKVRLEQLGQYDIRFRLT
jgi:hypothetical protein